MLSFLSPLLLAAVTAGAPSVAGGDVVAPTGGDGVAVTGGDEVVGLRQEFLEIAERLRSGRTPFQGQRTLRRLARRLEKEELDPRERTEVLFDLADALLQAGREDEAVARVEEAFEVIDGTPGLRQAFPDRFWRRGLAYWRQAEVENCIRRHNAECCILPLAGGGRHAVEDPAEEAFRSLRKALAIEPGRLDALWVLNVAAMALGRWPDGVPEELRIPAEAFSSEADVGRFRDVAPELGLADSSLCGGVVVDDLDGDGRLDLVTSTYDPTESLRYRRGLDGLGFVDATAGSGLEDQLGGLNLVGGDADGDGDADLLVLRGAWLLDEGCIRNSLLANDHGRFTDVTREAGLAEPAYPTQAACWGDFDLDGDLDLYVGNESRLEIGPPVGDFPSQLFVNDGQGRFTDRAAPAGVENDRYAKGVAAGDYDNDGDLDLYVSNVGANRLYRNDGALAFTDVARELGVVEPSFRSFACWFFDYDNDGWLDLFVAAFQATLSDVAADRLLRPNAGVPPRLYHNEGGTFRDVTRVAGLAHTWLPMGASFGDVDGDGWLDVYLATGDPAFETLVPNVLLRNDGGRRFQDATFTAGVGHLQKGHGVAFADLDDDGDQDLFEELGGFYPGDRFANALFLNPGHGTRFLDVSLVGTDSPRAGAGARLRVRFREEGEEREVHRAVGSVSSFGSTPSRQELGLGHADGIVLLEVRWPRTGKVQRFTDVPLDAWVVVTEGEAELGRRELHPGR